MKFYEYGKNNELIIILIHGAGWSNGLYDMHAQIWKDKYRVILPVIDGHGEEHNEKYISTEVTAEKLLKYIDDNCGGKVFALSGVSLGGQIVLELLNCRPNIAKKVIIESGLCIPQKLLRYYCMISYKILGKHRYSSIIKSWMNKNCKSDYFNISIKEFTIIKEETMLNILNAYYKYSLKEGIKETKADVAYWYGEKELKCIKESAKLVKLFIPTCQIVEMKNYTHGELSIYHPCDFINKAELFFKR